MEVAVSLVFLLPKVHSHVMQVPFVHLEQLGLRVLVFVLLATSVWLVLLNRKLLKLVRKSVRLVLFQPPFVLLVLGHLVDCRLHVNHVHQVTHALLLVQ